MVTKDGDVVDVIDDGRSEEVDVKFRELREPEGFTNIDDFGRDGHRGNKCKNQKSSAIGPKYALYTL
jgi:hypothetical protein